MNHRLPVGLVGCGSWGRHILRDLVSLGCDVFVVAQNAGSRQRAAMGGAAAVVNSIAALPEIAGAVVATPVTTHAAVIEELLARAIPVFTEKSLTADLAEADRLAQIAPDRLFVMDKWRYHPGIEMLAHIARTQELGPVIGLRTTRVQWGTDHRDVDCTWVLTPHDLSIALEILGHVPEPRSAVAERVRGLIVGMAGHLGETPWHIFEVSIRYAVSQRIVRLHCRDGVAVLNDSYGDYLEIARASDYYDKTPPVIERRAISTELPLLKELRVFVEHLQGGPPPRSSAAEGALIVRTIAQLRALAGLASY